MSETTTKEESEAEATSAAVGAVLRRWAITTFALIGACTLGLVLVIGASLLVANDDEPSPLFPDGPRTLPEPIPVPQPEPAPAPRTNVQAANVEYQADSDSDRIDVRHDGRCDNDARYSIEETAQEIRILAEVRTNNSRCESVVGQRFRLSSPVGDRIIVNASAGYSARPIVNR